MLVEKKTPGKFRVMVDNRLVNADCKPPVGAMSTVQDRPYTAMSIPWRSKATIYENANGCKKPQWQRSIKQ